MVSVFSGPGWKVGLRSPGLTRINLSFALYLAGHGYCQMSSIKGSLL